MCQVCKEQGRNSGSQHGRGNHERKRSSLSSAVAKRVAKGECRQQRRPGWRASDLLGKTQARQGLQKAHECADLKCSRHICAKHGSAGQCAWLASTGPSHDGRGLTGSRGDIPRPTAEASRRLMRDCVLQEEDAATERAEAKRAELGKISKELFGNGHPPGGRRA